MMSTLEKLFHNGQLFIASLTSKWWKTDRTRTPVLRIGVLLKVCGAEEVALFTDWLQLALEGELLRRPLAVNPTALIAGIVRFILSDVKEEEFTMTLLPEGIGVFQTAVSDDDHGTLFFELEDKRVSFSQGIKWAFREIQVFVVGLSSNTLDRDMRSLAVARLLGHSHCEYAEKVRAFLKRTITYCVSAWYDPFNLEISIENKGLVVVEALEAHPMDRCVSFSGLHRKLVDDFFPKKILKPLKKARLEPVPPLCCAFCDHEPCVCNFAF